MLSVTAAVPPTVHTALKFALDWDSVAEFGGKKPATSQVPTEDAAFDVPTIVIQREK